MKISKTETSLKVNLFITVSAVGLIAFLLLTTLLPFKDSLFVSLFPKQRSHANTIDQSPKVTLQLNSRNIIRQGVVNLVGGEPDLKLSWSVSQNPVSCVGQSYTPAGQDAAWDGQKDIKGGELMLTTNFPKKGVYLYAISCANSFGDSDGDVLVINIGSASNLVEPYITSFSATTGNQTSENSVLYANLNDSVAINWATLNTNSPYSICVTVGSWPQIFKNGQQSYHQELVLNERKAYKYTLFCSNENTFTKKTLTIYAD